MDKTESEEKLIELAKKAIKNKDFKYVFELNKLANDMLINKNVFWSGYKL